MEFADGAEAARACVERLGEEAGTRFAAMARRGFRAGAGGGRGAGHGVAGGGGGAAVADGGAGHGRARALAGRTPCTASR